MTTDSLTTFSDRAGSLPLPDVAAIPVAEGGIPPADSLSAVVSTVQAGSPISHTTAAAEIFGQTSQLADGTALHSAAPDTLLYLSGNLPYKLAVVGCFIGLCLLVYHFRPHFYTLFSLFRSKLYVEKLLDEQSYMFDTFLRTTTAGGLLLCGIAAVRYADLFAGCEVAAELPSWAICGLVPALWGAAALIALFQYGLLKISGNVTLSDGFTDRLIRLKRIVFSGATLLLAPAVLLFALTAGTAGKFLGYLLGIEIACIALFFLYQGWRLFIGQKISILQWILYLCAVEIFPVSLLVVILSKNW